MTSNDTPLDEMTKAQLRREYANALAGLTYDNATVAGIGRRMAEVVEATGNPVVIVKAIRALRVPCRRCGTTGLYARCWDVTDPQNPRPVTTAGSCYRCGGSGAQGYKDGHRNRGADFAYYGRGC